MRIVGLFAVLYPAPVYGESDITKLLNKITAGLGRQLAEANDRTRVDSAFKNKADISWRPDRYNQLGAELKKQRFVGHIFKNFGTF